MATDNVEATPAGHTPKAARMLSIDVLRGFDMFWIAGGEEIVNGLDKALEGPQDPAAMAAHEAADAAAKAAHAATEAANAASSAAAHATSDAAATAVRTASDAAAHAASAATDAANAAASAGHEAAAAAGLVHTDTPQAGIMHALAQQLRHVNWEGFRFYDMIFPLFLFLIGVSIVFSLGRIVREEGIRAAHWRVFRRFLIMYALGIFYYGGFSHLWLLPDGTSGIRLVGVLQRLALGYLFGSLLYLHFKEKGLAIALAVVLIGYWLLVAYVPAPGEPHASFEQGRNIVNYFDMHFVPGRMNDKTPDGNGGYFRWDPEGALSTIPAVGTAILGIFCGLLLKKKEVGPWLKIAMLVGAGAGMVALGYLWGGQWPWDPYLANDYIHFPIIKKLWTSSYVLVAGGYSCLTVALFYMVVDVLKLRFWIAPFIWIGTNSLAIYIANNLFDFEHLASRFVGGNVGACFGPYNELVLACTGISFVILFARWLYKHDIFIRI